MPRRHRKGRKSSNGGVSKAVGPEPPAAAVKLEDDGVEQEQPIEESGFEREEDGEEDGEEQIEDGDEEHGEEGEERIVEGDTKDDGDYNPKEANVEDDGDVDSDTEVVYVMINQIRGRGRPRLKRKGDDNEVLPKNKKVKKVFVDEHGKPLTIRHDEVVLPDDPKGEKKITPLGDLLGGRRFKVRTFTTIGRGDRKYMVSTDIARTVGYRDSYFLFQKHSSLFRVTISESDKNTMIKMGILPSSFKTRAVYLVTARSIYKEFGARVIVNGRQVTDDYYEDRARKRGAVEGAPAIAIIEPTLSHQSHKKHEPVSTVAPIVTTGDLGITWIYDNAYRCRQFESMLLYDRQEVYNSIATGKGERDSYTGVTFVPDTTQPTMHKVEKILEADGPKKLMFETKLGGSLRIKTGLADVPSEIYEGVVDDDVKKAIEEQQKFEIL
ncbi:DEKNAAC102360 [Brettanomyces naardenensis]|uniref:DEKNAAC102360 n=1 Tax=Brettanomyces naardenensis TaxID=13370 RepID=A0A448YKU3_BRENA|nr:DEKNAAC102360 [Brettanomyces naardenensis]